ncbi:hypothetical protein F6X51_18585 [Methylobacterium planeticum]|uniref:Uncharacterized protein n=1 Tax=Methylobacterium planeticum TaxID=2615211 RepID=A0A6N6MLV8_9HYPH|nr:hypothetical protein F6X51_18585 [Methylobacterium planeticum]
MTKFATISAMALLIASPAFAQGVPVAREPGVAGGAVIQGTPNNTGNDREVTLAPGATGASTIQTDSAAGGNAGQP